MQEVTRDIPLRSEGELRLHAAIRAVLSPGIWFVLAAQIVLVFSMQWRVPAAAAPPASALVIFLTAPALLLTGSDLKSLTQALSAFFGPATGALAFVFVYWLPFVFVQREFRLLPSLKA